MLVVFDLIASVAAAFGGSHGFLRTSFVIAISDFKFPTLDSKFFRITEVDVIPLRFEASLRRYSFSNAGTPNRSVFENKSTRVQSLR